MCTARDGQPGTRQEQRRSVPVRARKQPQGTSHLQNHTGAAARRPAPGRTRAGLLHPKGVLAGSIQAAERSYCLGWVLQQGCEGMLPSPEKTLFGNPAWLKRCRSSSGGSASSACRFFSA